MCLLSDRVIAQYPSRDPQTMKPTKLDHCLQGWPPAGPNGFVWENGYLSYMLPRMGFDTSLWDEAIAPTGSQWRDFWRICDEVGVWSWPATLGDRDVIDGLQWKLELEAGTRRVESRGQVWGSPPDFKPKLMRFHQALQAMTGWRG